MQGGIQSQYDAEILCQDFEDYKIDIGILQETKCGEFGYPSVAETTLICLESETKTPIRVEDMGKNLLFQKDGASTSGASRESRRTESVSQN